MRKNTQMNYSIPPLSVPTQLPRRHEPVQLTAKGQPPRLPVAYEWLFACVEEASIYGNDGRISAKTTERRQRTYDHLGVHYDCPHGGRGQFRDTKMKAIPQRVAFLFPPSNYFTVAVDTACHFVPAVLTA
jgi:hypothetical protein